MIWFREFPGFLLPRPRDRREFGFCRIAPIVRINTASRWPLLRSNRISPILWTELNPAHPCGGVECGKSIRGVHPRRKCLIDCDHVNIFCRVNLPHPKKIVPIFQAFFLKTGIYSKLDVKWQHVECQRYRPDVLQLQGQNRSPARILARIDLRRSRTRLSLQVRGHWK